MMQITSRCGKGFTTKNRRTIRFIFVNYVTSINLCIIKCLEMIWWPIKEMLKAWIFLTFMIRIKNIFWECCFISRTIRFIFVEVYWFSNNHAWHWIKSKVTIGKFKTSLNMNFASVSSNIKWINSDFTWSSNQGLIRTINFSSFDVCTINI